MKLFTSVLCLSVLLASQLFVDAKRKKEVDPKDCEVCVKVLGEIKDLVPKKLHKKKAKVESAIDKYCSNKNLDRLKKKICYLITPIKRKVSQPFPYMSAEEICK